MLELRSCQLLYINLRKVCGNIKIVGFKMKQILKGISIILIFFLLSFAQANKVYAFDEIVKQGQNFIQTGKESSDLNEGQLKINSSIIFNMLFTIGVILTVIIGGILGIQFMIASAEDKAKIKEMLIPFILGCVVIYGAFGIWKLVVSILQGI